MRAHRRGPRLLAVALVWIAAGGLLPACSGPGRGAGDAGTGVLATATGRPVVVGDGELRICPLPAEPGCPGLRLVGRDVGELAKPSAGVAGAVMLRGRVVGSRFDVDSTVAPLRLPASRPKAGEGALSCRSGGTASDQPEALTALVERLPAYAGRWWDDARQALVVVFAGPPEGYVEALAAVVGTTLCVAEVRFSLAELSAARDEIEAALPGWRTQGYIVGRPGVDVGANRVVMRVGVADDLLVGDVAARFGDRLQLEPFLQVTGAVPPSLAGAGSAGAGAATDPAVLATLAYHCGLGN